MKIVADTNIFLAVALNEPDKAKIIEVTEGCDAYAPYILAYEIGNALSAMVKRRQIRPEDVIPVFEMTQEVPVNLTRVDIKRALEIAVERNIYAYDAYFLQCAQALSCPIVTLDSSLSKTAREMSIKTLRLS